MDDDLANAIKELLERDREARRVVSAMCCAKEFYTHDRYRRTREQLEEYVAELRKRCPGFTAEDYYGALKRYYVEAYIR